MSTALMGNTSKGQLWQIINWLRGFWLMMEKRTTRWFITRVIRKWMYQRRENMGEFIIPILIINLYFILGVVLLVIANKRNKKAIIKVISVFAFIIGLTTYLYSMYNLVIKPLLK